MKITKRTLLGLLAVFFAFAILLKGHYYAEAKSLQEIQQEIEEYQREIDKLSSQANTLKNQIAQFNAQIYLASLKIAETEERITLLGGRIYQLEGSLGALSKAFASRVNETYKMNRLESAFIFLITSQDLSEAVVRYHYLKRIQEADRSLLVRLQTAQNTYQEEKTDQEDLQEDLEEQKQVLGMQKEAKASLLAVTRNDERRYQALLAIARAELEAIQSILVGMGEETEVGGVNAGNRIASIIPGSSACSTGTHLHLEIAKDQAHQNPASLLSSRSVEWDNGPDGSFSFTGSWSWPLDDPIRITQGYGMTYYAATLKYYGGSPHTGLDMVNENYTVKSIQPGTLYRGAIACGGGTLRYVKVDQNDGYDTYYLHVNY